MARVFLLAGAVAAVVSVADAHTAMVLPKPSYPQGFYQGMNPVMRIQSGKFGAGIPGYQGMAKITEAMKGQSSLKAFIMANAVLTGTGHATKECGWALANGEPQPVPAALDFPWGHPGPCEVWCDNTKVFYNENCMGNSVGKVPLGGKCDGAKMLQAMYIGTHVENWEVYMQCVPLSGGGGGGAGAGGNTPAGGSGNGNNNNNGNNNQNNRNNNGNRNNGQRNNNGQRSGDQHSYGFDSVLNGKRQLRA